MSWERPKREESLGGDWGPNLRLFNVETGEFVHAFPQRNQYNWALQFTFDEKYFARMTSNQIEFYESSHFVNSESASRHHKPWEKLRAEGCKNFALSPGQNYSVAVFIPEISGKPAAIRVYQFPNFKQPVSQKTFFKAETATMKWNKIGTALLVLASTDVDKSGKSYYGETNLYLLGITGAYDSRINLDKEGSIHGFAWSPNSREFGVVYGFMPSTTTIFDARGNVVHSFPVAPRNTIMFSPQARFILIAGFGNLTGTIDVYDRQKQFSKVAVIEASNTSVCEWSPDGQYILTATTSPRLRVDNGIKIWHFSGKLIYVEDFNELNAVSWRPMDPNLFPLKSTLPPAPAPHATAIAYEERKQKKDSSNGNGSSGSAGNGAGAKPAGAYVPPHARNRPGAAAHVAPTSLYERQEARSTVGIIPGGPKTIPGAAPKKSSKKNGTTVGAKTTIPTQQQQQPQLQQSATIVSPEEKRIRALLKKHRAIQDLKVRKAKGEKLEDTQLKKIATEKDVLQELTSLGWSE